MPLQSLLKFLRFAAFAAFVAALASSAHAATWAVRAQPLRLVNGSPVLFQVKAPGQLDALTGTWLEHKVIFSFDSSSKMWYALAGISLETAPGSYALELKGERKNARGIESELSFRRTFRVTRAKYPKIELTVESKFTEPNPEQLQKINEDKKIKQDYLNRISPDREWSGKFSPPADAGISDVFGTQRVFNGKTQSSHLGLDFRVQSGTPVAAMNSGTVLLARPLYFEGNCVVLDHGQGLLSIYMHLSEITVKEGEIIKRGEQVGLSGGTGRATGPHLHVAIRWQGVYLDPARLMRLSLP